MDRFNFVVYLFAVISVVDGTHLNAPYHFYEGGWKVADIPLHRLLAPGICINIKHEIWIHQENAILRSEHIAAWEEKHGRIKPGRIVLVHFGWGKYYNTTKYLYNDKGEIAFSGISKEAAQILSKRGVYEVGLDTVSIDSGFSTVYESHQIFSKESIFLMENVKLLSKFPVVDGKLKKDVDLTYVFDNFTVHWPPDRPFDFSKKEEERSDKIPWYASNEYCSGEHVGTHLDAPYHFYEKGWKVADIPLYRLMAPGICINMKHETWIHQENATLRPEHIAAWEKKHGRIKPGRIVLVHFGWGKYYNTTKYLYNDKGEMAFPGISKEAAQILAKRGVYGVGLDTVSIDPGVSTVFESHQIFSKESIFLMENVKLPSKFPEIGFELIALPMKIKDGTGAPLRLIARPCKHSHK